MKWRVLAGTAGDAKGRQMFWGETAGFRKCPLAVDQLVPVASADMQP